MNIFCCICFIIFCLLHLCHMSVDGTSSYNRVQFFDWKIEYATITRLCQSKPIMTVNGQFPGPSQYVSEGDTVIVKVTNTLNVGITIHWHGVRQLWTCWADGPAYVTQCPIQPGETYVHKFNVVEQRGTLLWHAHDSWQRATLHGAFIIFPRPFDTYPFPPPFKELVPVILGEWWNDDTEEVIAKAVLSGGAPNVSNAITINGQPGVLYKCSQNEVSIYNVEYGRTYMLRLINAAINLQLYFRIANHTLTIVEADAEYTEQLEMDVVVIAPGQTLNLLVKTMNLTSVEGTETTPRQFLMATSAFSLVAAFPVTPATAILSYNTTPSTNYSSLPLPSFPAFNDTTFVYDFYKDALKSQPFSRGFYYMDVPSHIDRSFLYTIGYGTLPCPPNTTCLGPNGDKFAASVNNISFVTPNTSVLEAYYKSIPGVYKADFPDNPENEYNYTGDVPSNWMTEVGTRVRVLPFNCTVQVVFQNTAIVAPNTHPFHLHGQNFWVVGMGLGNFNASSDPSSFNLHNPISRNTVVVPLGGWAAIRFRTVNPGAWLLHCHIDVHQVWGMAMVFIVENGENMTLPPPPLDFPRCQ